MAAVRSPLGNWPELGDVLFTDIMQELSLKIKIACESVCKQWRAQLLDAPAPRLWGRVVTVTNSVASAVTHFPEEPRIVLPGSDDHRLNLAEWLARRSTGMQYLRLHSTVPFNDASDDARKMCYLLEPLQAVAKPNLILDFMGAFIRVGNPKTSFLMAPIKGRSTGNKQQPYSGVRKKQAVLHTSTRACLRDVQRCPCVYKLAYLRAHQDWRICRPQPRLRICQMQRLSSARQGDTCEQVQTASYSCKYLHRA